MRVVLFGATGFLGSAVMADLQSAGHEVIGAVEQTSGKRVDLLDTAQVEAFLRQTQPEIVISCAGVIDNGDTANQNQVFTSNLLTAIVQSSLSLQRIIVSGSAAEYGAVAETDLPVDEDTPLNAQSVYGLSKLHETTAALKFAAEHNLPLTVARIFNPIGRGMQSKFLIPKLIAQVAAVKAGTSPAIEVSRLDSRRDYIDVRDVARAFRLIAEGNPSHEVYNVGSGMATSNAELIEMVLAESDLAVQPTIVETAAEPEALVAIQADISRLHHDFDWQPQHQLAETVKEIVHV